MTFDTTVPTHARGAFSGWRRILRVLVSRLWLCRQVRKERARLLALSDRELRDIGVSRYDALAEARKPFWR
jgi:uncharacterized protein YjiS (DUF1127 family)